jgi:hypothetical protein
MTRTRPMRVSLTTLSLSSMYLIMARKILESPFQTKILSKGPGRSLRPSTRRISVLSFSSSSTGMLAFCSRILRASSKGLISSMRMVRMTMSKAR